MSAKEYKEQLHEALLNLLWRQWAALGVAAHAGAQNAGSAVLDPEALLLFTARFCRCDQRLYDLVLNWLLEHESAVNLPRLKALAKKAAWQDSDSLAYMAAVVAGNGAKRWQTLAKAHTVAPAGAYEPLFRDLAAGDASYIPLADSLAETYGFRRNKFERQHKISPKLPQTTATLLLTLRACVGATARAEVLLLLLGSPCCSAAELAQRSGYARSSLHALLQELVAGNVAEEQAAGGSKLYVLRRAEEWRNLLGVDAPPHFPRWNRLYDALGLLWETVSNPRLAHLSETTFRGEIARVMKNGVRQGLLQCGLPPLAAITAENYADLPAALGVC